MAPPDNRAEGRRAQPPAVRPSFLRLLAPDLAAALAAATLVYCLFVYGAGHELFRDSDAGWHVRNGEEMLARRALPRADPYSFSRNGQPWFAWEWGTDVAMGLAHRVDGLRGVTALFVLAISGCSWLWCRLSFAVGGDFLLAGLLAPLMVTTTSAHWLARPHVFSWLFLLGAMLYAERLPERFGPRQLVLAAGATALWANLHASFFLAPAVLLLYCLSHLVRPLVWPLDARAERARARCFLWAALAALGGSLVNPYGWGLHAHVFSYLSNAELTSQIAEFQSLNFHEKGAGQVMLAMGLASVGGVLALSQKRLAHFLLAALFLWGGLRSARVLPLVALLILPLANGALVEAMRKAAGLKPSLRRALDSALSYSGRLRSIDMRMSGRAFSALVVFAALLVVRTPAYSRGIGFPPGLFPVRACQEVEKLPVQARILAPDGFGGYLIYRFGGSRKVYFDGRSDFYGPGFLRQYLVLISLRPGWREIVKSSRFTHALWPTAAALTAALEQEGWIRLYRDDAVTLLEAR